MLVDVKTFEVRPHRMRGIGQPARSERVRRQQVAELVMNEGLGNRLKGKNRQPQHNRRRAHGRY